MIALPANGRSLPFRYLPALFIATIFFLSGIAYYHSPSRPLREPKDVSSVEKSGIEPANGTLGFGGVYVVSGSGSSRRDRLLQRAAVTELNLTIPEQPVWTEDDLSNFKAGKDSTVMAGTIQAHLSHNLVLREFLASGQETALILEDDVDWDIRLRTQQVPLTQRAMRSLFRNSNTTASTHPWGANSDWDLLYIGHCGDYFNEIKDGVGIGHHHPSDLYKLPHVIFPDESVSYFTDLHPFTASLLAAFRIPEKHRVIHPTKNALCTFGYAVTRQGAQKIISDVAPPKEDTTRDDTRAYDIALIVGCHNKQIKCYTVQPELFHHMQGESIIATIEEGEREIFLPPVDKAGKEQVKYRHETSNIGCGFFSGDFYYDGNMKKLEYLREEVGRKGRCIKNSSH